MTNTYENRIVSYIDILGFKELIKETERDPSKLDAIQKALAFLKTYEQPNEWGLAQIELEEDAQKKGLEGFSISKISNCTCFSDSIVSTVAVTNENVNEVVSTVVANLANIGAKLFRDHGILLRGAITIGNTIHENSGIVFGQALIDAYEFEHNIAKQPRIIVSDKLIHALIYPLTHKRDRYPYHRYLKRFDDGCVGFHQMMYFEVLQSSATMNGIKFTADLNLVKRRIIEGLDKSFQYPDVHLKYQWMKIQYNQIIILEKDARERIHDLNENIAGNNIHFLYTDDFYDTSTSRQGN